MVEQEGKKTRMEVLEEAVATVMEQIEDIGKRLTAVEKSGGGKPKGLFGAHRERKAMKDTQTGVVYISKAALGKALCAEADTTVDDHFAYYKLSAKFPDRFTEATAEEKAKVEAEEAARVEKERQEEQAKLDAEAAKKEAEEGGGEAGAEKGKGGKK